MDRPSLARRCFAEGFGTFALVFAGCGAIVLDWFECAKANDVVPAVGLCRHCSVGLCPDHLIEASDYRLAGTTFGCPHVIPHVKSPHGVPSGIASSRRHHSAAVR